MIQRSKFLFLFLAIIFVPLQAASQERPDEEKLSIILTATEALLVTTANISQQFEQGIEVVTFSLEPSERAWTMEAQYILDDGQKGTVNYHGYRWGQNNTDWTINYFANGNLTETPIMVSGMALWVYNDKLSTHGSMEFSQVTKVGENSWWHFTRGAELILGGVAGAAAGIATAPALTPLGGLAVGLTSGATAANEFISLSENVEKTIFGKEGEQPSPPEGRVDTPSVPKVMGDLQPKNGRTVVIFSNEKLTVQGHGPAENSTLQGHYDPEKNVLVGEVKIK